MRKSKNKTAMPDTYKPSQDADAYEVMAKITEYCIDEVVPYLGYMADEKKVRDAKPIYNILEELTEIYKQKLKEL